MKIVGFYHCASLPNFNEVMSDQLTKMSESGLLDRLDEFHICMTGNSENFKPAQEVLSEYENIQWHYVNTRTDLGEFPTLDYLKQYCDKNDQEFLVMYLHLKGLSKYGDPYRNDWRQYMDYWQIERWQDCVGVLEQNYDTCGINYNDSDQLVGNDIWPHYSGNFWWARASYIRKLQPLQNPLSIQWGTPSSLLVYPNNRPVLLDPGNFRYEHEAWIGSANPAYFELAHSPGKLDHDFHMKNLWPRERFDDNINPQLKKR